jgi:hypothetical protein
MSVNSGKAVMDKGFYLALGVTLILAFAQWTIPIMPWSIGYAGIIAGIIVILSEFVGEFLGSEMSPPLGAVILFLIGSLFIGGAAHLYMHRAAEKAVPNAPQATVTPAPPTDEPLPKNATFKYGGKVYWAAPRRYTKEEDGEMRTAIREVYDSINTKSAPIISNWDGSAVVFTRNWLQIVQEEGRESAIAKLDDIRGHLRASYNDLQEILNRRPYYRQDIMSIINDRGEFGEMNGALNDYIEAVKTLPDKPGTDLVKRVIGPPEAALENAIKKYTNWMAAFNTKTLLMRDELEALMTG